MSNKLYHVVDKPYMAASINSSKNDRRPTKRRRRHSGDNDKSLSPEKSLNDHGVFLFSGEVNDMTCDDAIRFILEANLDKECKWNHMTMLINSPGGYCSDGFALIDTMLGSRIPIHTVGLGMIASMGLQIFLTGKKGTRTLTPNCMILSHQYTGGSFGKEHELIASQKEFGILSEIIMRHYKRMTGMTEKEVRQYLLPPEDMWLTAKEAKKHGICDIVKDLKPKAL